MNDVSMSLSGVSSSSSTVMNHRSPPLLTTSKGVSPPPPPSPHSPRSNIITRDTPNSTLAAMLADALSDAETYKRKYTEEKRRADYFEKLSEAFKQVVVDAKPNPAAPPSSSPVISKPASPSTAAPGAAQPSQPTSSPTDPGSASAASNPSNAMLADPKALADLISQLSQDTYRASCARDDEHARRLCISSLWKQLRDYLDLLDVQSKQAREALDKRIEMGGGDIVEVQKAELVEVQGSQIPALRDVATFTRVYDENGREAMSIVPNSHHISAGHNSAVLRKETKPHHSHSQSHGRRPRSGSLEPPPDGYPPHKRSRNQYPASNPSYPPQPQQIYLDPSPMPGYVGSPVFHEYQPLPSQHQPHPPSANSPPKKHQHIQPQPNPAAPQPPYAYSTFHSRSDTQTQRGRPPAPSSSSRKRDRSPEYPAYDGYPPQAMPPPPPPAHSERRERRERRRSRSRSVSSDRSLDEMLLDATTGDEAAQPPNGTQLPPIRYAGKGDRRDYPYPQNQLPPPQLPPPQGRTVYSHPPPPPVNGRYRSPSPRASDRERDRANSGGSTSSGYFTSVLGKTSNSKGRSPPASGPGDRGVLILDKASKSLPAIGTVEERGDRGGVVNTPDTLHLHPSHPPPPPPPHPSSSQSQGSLTQPPPQGYPPTNSAGQRICRQCGQPGRYKEGKCVEKWGPGPWGPGTVCDRCRKKMKRVERRGTLEQAQMLAAKQAEQARANAALANSQHNLGSSPNHLQRSDTVPNIPSSRDASFVYSSQSQATVEGSGYNSFRGREYSRERADSASRSARGTPARSRRASPSPPQQQLAPPRTIVPAPLPRVSSRPPSSHSRTGSRHSLSGGSVDADADADADASADGDDVDSVHDDVDRAVSAAAGVDDDKQEKGGEVEEDLLEAIDAAESQAMKVE